MKLAMTTLAIVEARALPAAMAPELSAAVNYAEAEKAEATRRAYRTDFRLFSQWCEAKGVSALPAMPETVAAYLAHGAAQGAKASTLGRRVAAIRYAHKLASLPEPTEAETVKATLRGIRRTIGAGKIQKAPALAGRIKAMVRACPDNLAGKRDRLCCSWALPARFAVPNWWPLTWSTCRRAKRVCAC
jgi:hypothetical protein